MNGNNILLTKKNPITENTNTGGSHGTLPPLPRSNITAENSSPKMKEVMLFLNNEFENAKENDSDMVFRF